MTPPIAILGAGPSGLTLARLLHVANIDFIVFDRDESATAAPTGTGGTLDIHAGSGQVALQEAGLLDQFKSVARYGTTVKVADAKGKVYIDVGEEDSDSAKPEIDRKDLRNLLLSSIPVEKIHWGYRVERLSKEADGSMSVHFVGGRVEGGFQLVVGADGAWSKARSLVSCPYKRSSDLLLIRMVPVDICKTSILRHTLLLDSHRTTESVPRLCCLVGRQRPLYGPR